METDSRQSSENCTAKSTDAGLGNKMASATWNGLKTVAHELKITDVEGAVRTESPVIIELEDEDVDVDGVPSANDQDPLQLGRKSPKIEPECYSDAQSVGSYNGPDPMGLLERIESTQEIDEDDEDENSEFEDDGSTTESRRVSHGERWQIWMKRWPWLLHEESDGDFAFCLYCNVNINVNNEKLKFVHQHNLSLYHQERENNYLAFKKIEKQSVESNNEIKHEFGSNEYVASMKRRRASEVDALNHFNWERWLQWHSWLQRIQSAGTIGLCKCCNVRMNVEFVYLRKRHEISKGHCEAKRIYDSSSRKRKRSLTSSEGSVENVPDTVPEIVAEPKNKSRKTVDGTVLTAATDNGDSAETRHHSNWYEGMSNTNPPQCRCTLCNLRMSVSSFSRHLKTKTHCTNLSNRQKEAENNLDCGIWAQYADKHPWLTADPNDPTLAYCRYCSKRFIYGHSEIKRKIHENSDNHKAKVQLAASDAAAATREDGSETVTAPDENVTQGDPVQSEAQLEESEAEAGAEDEDEVEDECSDDDYVEENSTNSSLKSSVGHTESETNTSKTRRAKEKVVNEKENEDEVNNESEPTEDATENIVESPTTLNSKKKLTRQAITKQKIIKQKIIKQAIKRVPSSMHGKVMAWRARFPWISYKRNEPRKNYGYCKLCDTSVFMPSSKYASKHQRSSRHIRLRHERKRGVEPSTLEDISMATATAAALATGESRHKAAMAELQAKYNWLQPDATDENYCHCKLCCTRLPIKVFFLRQHDSSRKHADSLERIRSNCEMPTEAPLSEQPEQEGIVHVDQDRDQDLDSDEALSVKSECSNEEHSMSKRSRKTMEMRRIIRALRDTMGKKAEDRSHMDMARDMICSSFDIVKRIRTLERETDLRDHPSSSMQPQRGIIESPSKPRDTLDLFFDSIVQTMKSLPADLAAEGKSQIMQIVCNLELRGMQRTAPTSTSTSTSPSPSPKGMPEKSALTSKNLNQERMTFEEVINAATDSESSSVICEDQGNETPSPIQTPFNKKNDIGHLCEITGTQCSASPSPSSSTPTPTTTTATAAATSNTAPTFLNGLGKDKSVNIRSILPSTLLVAPKNPESVDQLRMVPINKLTTANPNRSKVNGMNSTATPLNRNPQSQKIMSPNTVVATPPSCHSSSHSDMNNGTTTNPPVFRNIRVSNGNSTQVIRFQNATMGQQKSIPQRKLSIEKMAVRYNTTSTSTTTNHSLTQQQVQALAQAQLRALKEQCPLTSHVPRNKASQP